MKYRRNRERSRYVINQPQRNMMNIKDLIEHLETYDPETPCAYDLWLPDDVKCVDETREFTDDEIANVLDHVQDTRDATLGINWDTLEYAIDQL